MPAPPSIQLATKEDEDHLAQFNSYPTRYNYLQKTPSWMKVALLLTASVALFPLGNLVYLGTHHLELGFTDALSLTSLGQLGDFFGGHTAAFAGSMSLLVVLFFTFHQAKQQALFFETQRTEGIQQANRTFFLEGVNLISQWDIASPGCDQSLRLLDYYGRIALRSQDKELLLILNTVVTAQIRANLEGKNGSFRKTNYPYACKAIERIAELRKEDGLALRKPLLSKETAKS